MARFAGRAFPQARSTAPRPISGPTPSVSPAAAVLFLTLALTLALALCPPSAAAQTTNNPFQTPIEAVAGRVVVDVVDFASLPDADGQAARMMLLVDEPATGRMYVNDMRGTIYSVSYDGRSVRRYLDANDPAWGVGVEAGARERGMQSFAFHPDFGRTGTRGYGRFYTWMDVRDNAPVADFQPGGGNNTHHTLLLEWTARNPSAGAYDGAPPRELMRFEQPFANHNGGHLTFNPLAAPDDADYGLLYVGSADGGSGGDPLNLSQNLASAFGKILRIDPLGSNSANGNYGIPEDNPFASDGDPGTLDEIWASGVRNPQRFGWDPANGNMFVADIGQNIVETLSPVTRGANLGWNAWEGSYRFISRAEVSLEGQRSDPGVTYPIVEYGQIDPLLQNSTAITGVHVYRAPAIPQLQGRLLFGDFPSGEIFHIDADHLPNGGHTAIRRVLLRQGGSDSSGSGSGGEAKTFLELIQAKNASQNRTPATRADLRFGAGPDGRVFLLNKHDGTIRELVPG